MIININILLIMIIIYNIMRMIIICNIVAVNLYRCW